MMKELVLKNWKTTLVGIVSIVMFGLVNFGVLTPEQSQGISDGVNAIAQNVESGVTLQAVSNVLLVIGNALLLFVKDPKKVTN